MAKPKAKTKKGARKWVREHLLTTQYDESDKVVFDLDELKYGTHPLDVVIAVLTQVESYYARRGFRRIEIKPNMYDDDRFELTGEKQETTEQYEKRITQNKKAAVAAAKRKKKSAAAEEQKDLKEYERLVKKYGTPTYPKRARKCT